MSHILIADDDIELCAMLREYLEIEGFEVSEAHDGEAALELATTAQPDAMVLDIMMPKMNGFDVLRALRPQSDLPVLMLTARGEDIDSIIGLELGADDYLGKPSSPRVLVARLRALLRRSSFASQTADSPMQFNNLTVDSQNRTATLDGQVLELTSTEFSLLLALSKDAGKILSKSELSQTALGRPLAAYDRSIDMHISHLRKKLGEDGQNRIKTVRGIGYQFSPAA